MSAFTYFDSWIEYVSNLLYAPTPPAAPNTNQYRVVLTNNLPITRSMTKAELISAELLPTNGYSRKVYAPGTGGSAGAWDANQMRYENAPVNVSVSVTNTEQWSAMLLWSNSPADVTARTVGIVNPTSDRLTIPNHAIASGAELVVTSTGTRPGGTIANTLYYAQIIDTNSIALHSSPALNSLVNITDVGSGTHHVRLAGGRPVLFLNVGTQTIGSGAQQSLSFDLSTANGGDSNGV